MLRGFVLALLVFGVSSAQVLPERILERAITLHKAGDIDGAIREYRAYLKLRPGAAEIHSNLGTALVRAGRYEEAIAEYKQALAKDPGNPPVRLNLAQIGRAHV